MNPMLTVTANVFIDNLRKAIDEIWARHGNTSLNSIIYDQQEYGVMQYAELAENLEMLLKIKKNLDSLAEECSDLSDFEEADAGLWPMSGQSSCQAG